MISKPLAIFESIIYPFTGSSLTSSAVTTIFESSARDSPTVENALGMKKDIDTRKVVPPVNDPDEDDILGDRVQINGAPFRVSGRDFVPEAEYKQPVKSSE